MQRGTDRSGSSTAADSRSPVASPSTSVLIVGGSGTLGRLVVRGLRARGVSVRVMTRKPAAVTWAADAGAEIVAGDLLDPSSVQSACRGVQTLVCAAHSMLGRGAAASEHVDGTAHRRLIDVARSNSIGHLVYTSVHFPAPEYESVPFFRIKREVEEYVAGSGVPYTILRPTAFMDFHAHVLLGVPVLSGGRVMVIGEGLRPRNYVAARDVAAMVELAVADPSPRGTTLEIGGPENLSPREVIALYERVSGRTARIGHLPLAVARTVSALTRRVHPGLSQVLQLAVLADTVEQPFDPQSNPRQYPVPMTTLADWVREHVAAQMAGTGAP